MSDDCPSADFIAAAIALLRDAAQDQDDLALALFERHGAGWTVATLVGQGPDRDKLSRIGSRLFAAIDDWPDEGLALSGRPVWRWARHALGLSEGHLGHSAHGFAIRDRDDRTAYPVAALLALAGPDGLSPDQSALARARATDLRTCARQDRQAARNRIFTATADVATYGTAVADMSRRDLPVRFCNRAFVDLTGQGEGASLALDGPLFSTARFDGETRPLVRDAMAKGNRLHTEVQLRGRGGKTFWAELALFPIEAAGGGSDHLAVTLNDISLRRLGEEERVRIRRLLLDAIESTSEGFMLLNQEERIILVNQRYRDLYPPIAGRIRPGERFGAVLKAMVDADLHPPGTDGRAWIAEELARLRARRSEGAREQPTGDGRVIRVSDRPTASGGIVSTRTDITALRRSDDLSQLRLHAIEASRDGIAICDPHGCIVYANAAMARMFGHEETASLAGRPLSVLHDRSEALRFEVEVMPSLARDRFWRGQARGRRLDGSTLLQDLTLTRLDDGSIVCASRDITDQVRAAEEHAALQAQFFQSQKMEAIGQLAGGIAHDFNNILSSILGYATFLAEDLEEGSDLRDFAQNILQSGNRAKGLVKQILAFSRNDAATREPGDLVKMVTETVDMLEATLPPSITLESHLGCPTAPAAFDATQINQVLMNLCVNARDAMEGAGRIDITLDAIAPRIGAPDSGETAPAQGPDIQEGEDGAIHLAVGVLEPAEGYFRITVSDTGSGIPRTVMERMFEPFFTTKSKNEGTGLGLAAVHGIVLAHGGRIEIVSRPGTGTSFRIVLPANASVPTAITSTNAEPPRRGTETILLVDDDLSVAQMTERALERLGYAVMIATAPDVALTMLRGGATAFDLVITDYTMPHMTGLDFIREMRAQSYALPVILYTGYAEAIDEEKALAAGASAFLRKPFEPAALSRLIGRLMAEQPSSATGTDGA